MDPNIITIDSDDSNDTNLLPSKNNQSSLVIVHRVINTNYSNSNNQNNCKNSSQNDMVNHCSVDQQALQNNNHFNPNLSNKDHHEIIPHRNEIKQKSNYDILESQISQCTEIIDVENYNSTNRNPISKGRTLYGEEILNINSYNKNRNNLASKKQSFNNKEVINLCSDKEPIRPPATFLQTCEKRNMNQPSDYEHHPMAWSHNTANFMKHSVNSVMQGANKVVVLQNPPTAHQNSMSRHHLTKNQEFLQENMYNPTDIRNVQSIYHSPTYSCMNMNNPNYFQPGYYNNGIMMNSYVPNNNFWMRVKVEEIHNGGEVVAQYFYNNETQTPVSIENHFQVNAIASDPNPQFIDISALSNITDHKPNDNNKLDEEKSNNIDDEKAKSICETPLLKRQLTKNTNGVVVGDKDVIFVGEFKQNSDIGKTNCKQNSSSDSGESSKTEVSIMKNVKNDETKPTRKRLRKSYETIEPRRNPKRQVQASKEFTKLIDDILWSDIDKENKMKKIVPKANKERTDKKPIRFSPRVHTTCGAVYSPPSPLSADHIRKWPTEGMHEKPEYNPQTGEIEPFDYVTRSIADSYKSKIKSTNTDHCNSKHVSNTTITNNKTKKTDSIDVLSHKMLHHMISYAATAIQMNNCSNVTDEENKVHFLNDLGLAENEDALTEKICDNIKEVFKNIIHSKDTDKNNDKHNLKELLKSTMLMYCITNDVSQSDLVKYIDSLKPQDIINISNEQLGIANQN